MRSRGVVITLVLLSLAGGSVACSAGATPSQRQTDEHTKELQDLAAKREARQKELAGMSFDQLSQTLRDEAAKNSAMGDEPFNSMAYQEMVRRGDKVARDLAALFSKDGNDLFNLLALRTVDRAAYSKVDPKRRADILVGALGRSVFFNTWGMPHLQWYDGSQAIIDLGKDAEPNLIMLLDSTRPAPSWGSEEAAEYAAYRYRVRDYAWVLLLQARGAKQVDIPRDPAQRDRLIAALPR
jgi:hypothetical protein